LFLARPSPFSYTAERSELELTAGELIKNISAGKIKINIDQTYPLSEVVQAHTDLEVRKTTGCTVLIP